MARTRFRAWVKLETKARVGYGTSTGLLLLVKGTMKNLTLYSVLVLAFVLTISLMFVRVPINPDLSNDEAPARPLPPPVKSAFISAPDPDIASVTPPSPPVSVKPAPQPAHDDADQALPAPGSDVLMIPGAVGEAEIPVAMIIKDDPNLSSDQREKINQITQSFAKEMTYGTCGNLNPDDPAYLVRWQEAQAKADESLRYVLGEEDYLKYSLAAARMSTNP
jgi:hypothetical protein